MDFFFDTSSYGFHVLCGSIILLGLESAEVLVNPNSLNPSSSEGFRVDIWSTILKHSNEKAFCRLWLCKEFGHYQTLVLVHRIAIFLMCFLELATLVFLLILHYWH